MLLEFQYRTLQLIDENGGIINDNSLKSSTFIISSWHTYQSIQQQQQQQQQQQ